MKSIIAAICMVILAGCATPVVTIPENVEGIVCTSVTTLTTTVVTVVANKTNGNMTATPECAVSIKN